MGPGGRLSSVGGRKNTLEGDAASGQSCTLGSVDLSSHGEDPEQRFFLPR